MTTWITRAQIGLRPREGGGVSLRVTDVDGYAWHWPGMAGIIDARGDIGFRRVCSALRGWQAYHMDVRGWSDIAYCWAVDQVGRKYTLRGQNIKSGANGNDDVNTRYGAGLLILGPGEQPSAAMIATVKETGGEFCARFSGARRKPYGHRDVRPGGTTCPGDEAYDDIQDGKFTPGSPTPTPPEDDMSDADVQKINSYTEAVSIQIQKHIDQVLPVELAKALAADNDLQQQIADVYTPESGDTAAATTLLTWTAPRAATLVVQQLQPVLDEILARLAAIEASNAPKA